MSRYLTSIKLNNSLSATRKIVRNLEPLHAVVEKTLPNDTGRVLWRLDKNYEGYILYIASDMIPDATAIAESYGYPRLPYDDTVKTVDMTRFLDGLSRENKYGFRVAVNPVSTNGRSGRKTVMFGHNAEAWLNKRMEANGFHVEAMRQVDESHRMLRKESSQPTNKIIGTFDGVLTIVDTQKAREAIESGVGGMKAYGCGLITLVPLS